MVDDLHLVFGLWIDSILSLCPYLLLKPCSSIKQVLYDHGMQLYVDVVGWRFRSFMDTFQDWRLKDYDYL